MTLEHPHRRAVTRRLCGLVLALLVAAAPITLTRVLAAEPVPPTLLLAERYHGNIDVSRYWISEKLDGVRAIWDGKTLRFRSGNPAPAPRWFIDALPRQPLDGELWLGRSASINSRPSFAAKRPTTRSGGACAT